MISVVEFINENKKKYIELANKIWEYAEVALEEVESVKKQIDLLYSEEFKIIKSPFYPTAFMAEYGKGRPVIGLLGEYDALPGLSQAINPEKKPIPEKTSGHDCGHNLLGIGAVLAAVAVKEVI